MGMGFFLMLLRAGILTLTLCVASSAFAKSSSVKKTTQQGTPVTSQTRVATSPSDKKTTPPEAPYHLFAPLVWGEDEEWRLQFGGDINFRNEHRSNFDMKKKFRYDDHLSFMRTRVNVDVFYRKLIRAYVELIDADVYGEQVNPFQTDHWDLFQAFLELKDCEDSPWTLRVGRQLLPIISEGRIFGMPPPELYWFNLLPVFDGAMLNYKTPKEQVHLFLLQPDTPMRLRDGVVLESGHLRQLDRTWFYGMYGNFKYFDQHDFDVYLMGLSDQMEERNEPRPVKSEEGRYGTTDRYTVGSRWRGPIYKWDGCGTLGYGLEGAYQFGHLSNDEISAYMLHADVNYVWEHPWKPKVTLLGNLASGDDEPGDGKSNTFSPLYGSSHYAYGIIDFTRLQNLREVALTGSIDPTEKLRVQSGLHKFWLDSPTDAWYTALGNPGSFGRDVDGKSGRELGEEIDLTFTYKYSKCLSFETGAAHFFPGEFAKNKGKDDGANFFFFQTYFKF